eukprot:6490612-Amphidinium_carterae.1
MELGNQAHTAQVKPGSQAHPSQGKLGRQACPSPRHWVQGFRRRVQADLDLARGHCECAFGLLHPRLRHSPRQELGLPFAAIRWHLAWKHLYIYDLCQRLDRRWQALHCHREICSKMF